MTASSVTTKSPVGARVLIIEQNKRKTKYTKKAMAITQFEGRYAYSNCAQTKDDSNGEKMVWTADKGLCLCHIEPTPPACSSPRPESLYS